MSRRQSKACGTEGLPPLTLDLVRRVCRENGATGVRIGTDCAACGNEFTAQPVGLLGVAEIMPGVRLLHAVCIPCGEQMQCEQSDRMPRVIADRLLYEYRAQQAADLAGGTVSA